jgi:hypothetical protein
LYSAVVTASVFQHNAIAIPVDTANTTTAVGVDTVNAARASMCITIAASTYATAVYTTILSLTVTKYLPLYYFLPLCTITNHYCKNNNTAQSGTQSRRGSAATSTSLAGSVRRTSNAGGVPSTPDRAGSRRSSVEGTSSAAYTGMQLTLLRLIRICLLTAVYSSSTLRESRCCF